MDPRSNKELYFIEGISQRNISLILEALLEDNDDVLKIVSAIAVRELYEIVPARKWKETERKMSKIVFIGRDLDETVFAEFFPLLHNVNRAFQSSLSNAQSYFTALRYNRFRIICKFPEQLDAFDI
ncbi:hypothetical protein HPP92_007703 [Vanilla planifolia]|uniref:CobW C-terminal domain-containing protein n=1 Tax=Vanilla planifolia TaxID=51239 RepID=A0A835VBH4_VANPL|nr:hypothetical protein HPP92_007703 [Vanilla planifolia]